MALFTRLLNSDPNLSDVRKCVWTIALIGLSANLLGVHVADTRAVYNERRSESFDRLYFLLSVRHCFSSNHFNSIQTKIASWVSKILGVISEFWSVILTPKNGLKTTGLNI